MSGEGLSFAGGNHKNQRRPGDQRSPFCCRRFWCRLCRPLESPQAEFHSVESIRGMAVVVVLRLSSPPPSLPQPPQHTS